MKLSFIPLIFFLLIQLFFLSQQQIPSHRIIPVKDPNNIVLTFGSCNSFFPTDPSDIFDRIVDVQPDAWAWLGDVVYIDVSRFPPDFKYPGKEKAKARFYQGYNNPQYKHLRESTKVIGVWDDHDYGKNNAGRSFPFKKEVQQLWLDFIDEPKDSARRKREGIYESYYLGDEQKVKVILLDVRYSKEEPWFLSFGANDILGEEQWNWLENELKENKADYVVIGSGVQILPDDRVLPERFFDKSKEKLLGLIRKYKVGGVLLLSGDVHFAEIMKYPCPKRIGFELYEFTSSGMTHYASSHVGFVSDVLAELYPYTYNTVNDKYFERNFGVLRFGFGEKKGVKLEVRNYYGEKTLEKDIGYSQLAFNEKILDDKSECVVDIPGYQRFLKHIGKSLIEGKKYVYLSMFIILFVILLLTVVIKLAVKIISFIFRRLVGGKKVTEKSKRE